MNFVEYMKAEHPEKKRFIAQLEGDSNPTDANGLPLENEKSAGALECFKSLYNAAREFETWLGFMQLWFIDGRPTDATLPPQVETLEAARRATDAALKVAGAWAFDGDVSDEYKPDEKPQC